MDSRLSGLLGISTTADGNVSSTEIIVEGTSLTGKFDWLLSNAQSGKTYVIILDRDETLTVGQNLDYDGRIITLILRGRGAMRRISLTASRSLLTVRSGVTLILDNNITLQGYNTYTNVAGDALVRVGSGAELIMNDGTTINGHISGNGGGGVYVSGTFIMNGGTISGCYGARGGGVYIEGGTFVMNNGIISGNSGWRGGGVTIFDSGTFTMTGGAISGNITNDWHGGAGVYLYNGTFTMSGGSISGNSATVKTEGGGVLVGYGTFTMTGGSISGNSVREGKGGGVYVSNAGTFNLNSPATKSSISSNNDGTENPQVYADGNFRVNGLQERGY
jgi:hypothetical protein